ncbi:MAG: DUF4198 domain-containing protein [Acidobacteria bacterium]|nr:DUF4198 domain-containing protein [Acidobacteriota bacterium]MBI3656561.1 DUF4198 domain-containing protein [Acidobacteriota bacterium]
MSNSAVKKLGRMLLVFGCGFMLMPSVLEAHYIWIAAEAKLSPGKTKEVSLCYGEFPHRERAGRRLEEIAGIKAWVRSPSGTVTAIALAEEGNSYSAPIAPKEVGIYNITAVVDRGVVDWTKYNLGVVRAIHYARAQLALSEEEKPEAEDNLGPYLDLDIVPVTETVNPAAGSPATVRVMFKGKPLPHSKVIVHADNDWMREIKADAWGIATFTTPQAGHYVVEVIYTDWTPGEYQGKKYEATRHRATLSLESVRSKVE